MATPSDTAPVVSQNVSRPVYVAIYEHPHGTDVRVFIDEDRALVWRTRIAQEWWSDAFDDDPPSDAEIGAEYFERMLERDGFFSTMRCDLETDQPDPAGQTPSDGF